MSMNVNVAPELVERAKPRKVLLLLTDAEWRAVRVGAAGRDTSIQGYVATAVLLRVQDEERETLGTSLS